MAAKRLVARLREHDWLAAFIELVIVVVGILIALQVSNWNQDRVDRARADRYYARLHADLATDVSTTGEAIAFWAQVTKFGEQAMAYSEQGARVDGSNWKTLLAYYQASQIYPFELADTTFVEMRASGDLALIVDENLRKRLADYYRLTGNGMRSDILRHNPVYRMQIRGLTPWSVQQYIWEHCFRQGSGAQQILVECKAPLGEDEAAAILDTCRRDPTLLQNLRAWMSQVQVSSIIVSNVQGETHALIASVDAAHDGKPAAAAPPQ
ncbi:MAG: hypothetical protein JSS21_06710 [Proteobacteria bacterium]|nr:hypothetical protein [Pseudomonadota bacterium]